MAAFGFNFVLSLSLLCIIFAHAATLDLYPSHLGIRNVNSDVAAPNQSRFCSMRGTKEHNAPPFPCEKGQCPAFLAHNMTAKTCQGLYPEGSYVCCSIYQTEALKTAMTLLRQIFSKCPACQQNLLALWCGYTCAPNQWDIVKVVKTQKMGNATVVYNTTFTVNRKWAQQVYESCQDVEMEGGTVVKAEFNTYLKFLNWMGTANDVQKIAFIYADDDQESFSAPVNPCNVSCSCQNCKASCVAPPNLGLNLNGTQCQATVFGEQYYCLSIGLVAGYIFFVLLLFLVGGLFVLFGILAGRRPLAIICSADLESADRRRLYSYRDAIFKSPPSLSLNSSNSETSTLISHGRNQKGYLQRYWAWHGRFVARHPIKVIAICLLFTAICGAGILQLEIEERPEKLWVSPTSRAAQDKADFDSTFGPFFRIEQLIFTSKQKGQQMIDFGILQQILDIQLYVMGLNVTHNNKTYKLDDLCYKPIPGKGCIIESVLEFWQTNRTKFNEITNPGAYVSKCLSNLFDAECMSSIGAPVDPHVVFGGFDEKLQNYENSTALVITFLLNNWPENHTVASLWEEKFLQVASQPYSKVNIAYSAQRSIQDELARESSTDVPTVIFSYAIMFLYVSMALGQFYPITDMFFVKTRFTLGMGGVGIVILSLIISVGLNSFWGVKATLIISEVIPFLVLAIGVDNIFILVNTFERMDPASSVEDRMAETMARVASSMTLASLAEALAFLLGSLTRMPAVEAFAYYASVAIFFDYILQVTCFASLLALDARRVNSNRVDCMPCMQVTDYEEEDEGYSSCDDSVAPESSDTNESSSPSLKEKEKEENDEEQIEQQQSLARNRNSNRIRKRKTVKRKEYLRSFIEKYYAPFLMRPIVKVIIIFTFLAFLFVGINFAPHLSIGLAQQEALPTNSYLINYFDSMSEYLAVGSPLYIVIKPGLNYSIVDNQNLVCSDPGCDKTSITNVYDAAPYIAGTTYSWLDDYLEWVASPACCLTNSQGQDCVALHLTNCDTCFDLDDNARPPPWQFNTYLPWFLNSTVQNSCKLTGQAYPSDVVFMPNGTIKTTRLRLYHSVLKTQEDFINALKVAYAVADMSELNIYPYSVFYIFFEQYLYIVSIAIQDSLYALAGVFLVTLLLLQDPWMSILITGSVAMVETNLLGVMYLWNISLNAISVVNLVMCIGIAVEFHTHIAHSFLESRSSTKTQRAVDSLSEMGSSVFSGITLTKFFGVVVLAFSASDVFKIYYFRMYLAIVLIGALHGLMFFPVLLSLVGPQKGWFLECLTSCFRRLKACCCSEPHQQQQHPQHAQRYLFNGEEQEENGEKEESN